ncbi:hypothetical protein IQ07DRAFT_406553 [Pyrenochaeta sp. DS3sAY3a]|nr:hypothetical protein IQ07DRAFT_406553 [Pyrenochaeta sp. DS3sAY3a]
MGRPQRSPRKIPLPRHLHTPANHPQLLTLIQGRYVKPEEYPRLLEAFPGTYFLLPLHPQVYLYFPTFPSASYISRSSTQLTPTPQAQTSAAYATASARCAQSSASSTRPTAGARPRACPSARPIWPHPRPRLRRLLGRRASAALLT